VSIESKTIISVIVPVLNEGCAINKTVEQIRKLDVEDFVELIIVDGNKDGSTVKEITDKNVFSVISDPGRGKQMNRGAESASGRILVFLHSDTILPEKAFGNICKVIDSGGFMAGAFDLGLQSDEMVFKIIAFAASLKHRFTRVPYGDQAIFITKKFFLLLGGYREIPLMEDVDLMKRIKRRGDKIYIIPEKVSSSVRNWEKGGVFYTIFRNYFIQILFMLGVSPEKLAGYYYKKNF